jgi:hypothetical protein
MAVRVDEAGADDAARALDRLVTGQPGSDHGDAAAFDPDVRHPPRRPGAVDDGSTLQDAFECHAPLSHAATGR